MKMWYLSTMAVWKSEACRKMNETRKHCSKRSNPGSERQGPMWSHTETKLCKCKFRCEGVWVSIRKLEWGRGKREKQLLQSTEKYKGEDGGGRRVRGMDSVSVQAR